MQGRQGRAPAERLFKDANHLRNMKRQEMFKRNRDNLEGKHEHLEQKIEEEELYEFDYLEFYPARTRKAIINSLTAPIPDPLPPLDPTTISFYRRQSKPIYQTRVPGSTELDPHLTHESLHILSTLQDTDYPNFLGLTREFQRDLRLYLSAKSKDIHAMAIIAAGNRIIGRERDVLAMVEEDQQAMWVLFNHVISQKISYQTLLPYIIKMNSIAFRAFYEYSNINGQECIAWFFDREEVVEALLKGLDSNDSEIRNLTLRILGNVLGEGQIRYIYVLINSTFLDRVFRFLLSSEAINRKDGCWALANFCSYEPGAIAVGRNPLIAQKLKELLYYETNLDVRKEIAHIFSSLIGQADKPAIFQFTASKDFLQMMVQYLGQEDHELATITLGVLEGLICLGDEFKDENELNVVALMMLGMPELMYQIRNWQQNDNSSVSEASNHILTLLSQTQKMEGEC